MNPNKEKLIALSTNARALREEKGEDESTINKILIKYFYTDENNTDFNSYKQWLEMGYQVKRGEKAFLVWGRKRTNTKKQEEKPEKEQDEYKFYPLSYLFSNAQVEPIQKNDA